MIEITDLNYMAVTASLADAGHGFGALPRQSPPSKLELAPGLYAAPYNEDEMPLIPEDQWRERVEEAATKRLFVRHAMEQAGYKPEHWYQDGFNWCWAASGGQSIAAARVVSGMNYRPLAWEAAAELVAFSNRGYYLDKWIAWAAKHGIPERSYFPPLTNDRNKLQAGYQANAANYRPIDTEIWDCGTDRLWAKTVTAILCGFSVYWASNKLRHAMSAWELQYDSRGELCLWTPNTHGDGKDWLLKGSVKVPDEVYILRSVTYYEPEQWADKTNSPTPTAAFRTRRRNGGRTSKRGCIAPPTKLPSAITRWPHWCRLTRY